MENGAENVKSAKTRIGADRVDLGLVVGQAYRALLEFERLQNHLEAMARESKGKYSRSKAHDEILKEWVLERANEAQHREIG